MTVRGPKGARVVSITPPPGHYELGAVGLHRRFERSADERCRTGRRLWPHKTRAGRQATGILKLKTSRSLASCSPRFIARPSRPEARPERIARPMTHARKPPMLPPLSTFELSWMKPPYL